jgi:prolyl 4-hydroxylase
MTHGIVLSSVFLVIMVIMTHHIITHVKRVKRQRGQCADNTPSVYNSFLTPTECQRLIQAAQRVGLNRSTVADTDGSVTSQIRTSSHAFLQDDEPIAKRIKRKVEILTGLPASRMEQIQIVHYSPGQQYKPHYDACMDKCHLGSDLPRTETVMMYLNTVERGGCTVFPTAKTRVSPKQGRAVWWKNMDAQKNVLPCAYHGAEPVIRGEKWGATIWIR